MYLPHCTVFHLHGTCLPYYMASHYTGTYLSNCSVTSQWYLCTILHGITCQWYLSFQLHSVTSHWYLFTTWHHMPLILIYQTAQWYLSTILHGIPCHEYLSAKLDSFTCQWYLPTVLNVIICQETVIIIFTILHT